MASYFIVFNEYMYIILTQYGVKCGYVTSDILNRFYVHYYSIYGYGQNRLFNHFESQEEYTERIICCIIDLKYFKLATYSMKTLFGKRFKGFRKPTLMFVTSTLRGESKKIHFPSFPTVDKKCLHCNK